MNKKDLETLLSHTSNKRRHAFFNAIQTDRDKRAQYPEKEQNHPTQSVVTTRDKGVQHPEYEQKDLPFCHIVLLVLLVLQVLRRHTKSTKKE